MRYKIKKFNKFFINSKTWQSTILTAYISKSKNLKNPKKIVLKLSPFFRFLRFKSHRRSVHKKRDKRFKISKKNDWQIKKLSHSIKKIYFSNLLNKKIKKDKAYYVEKLKKKQIYFNSNFANFIHYFTKKKRSRFYKFIFSTIKFKKYIFKKSFKYFKSHKKQRNKINYIKKYIKKLFLKNKIILRKVKKLSLRSIKRRRKKFPNVKKKKFYSPIVFIDKKKLSVPTSKNLFFLLEPKHRKLLNKKRDKLFSVRQFFNAMINYNFVFKLRKFKKIFIKTFLKVLIHKPSIRIYFIVRKLWGSIRTADMFAEAIIMRLLKKNPIKIIVLSIVRRFKKYFVDGRIGAYAILFAGRFNRKDRAMYAWYRRSKYSRSNRIVVIDYSNRRVALKYSSCSLKISLIRSIFNNILYEF